MLRDMTLLKFDDAAASQIYTSENNETIHISQFSDDYTQPIGDPHRKLAQVLGRHTGFQ